MNTPIFAFFDHFDAAIQIGDATLPIKVKRFCRTEREAFEKEWDALITAPRGTAVLSEEAEAAREAQQQVFLEAAIVDAITLAPGLVQVNGVDVVTGAGLIEIFHARVDVLSNLALAIYTKNRLTDLVKKTSSLPPDSATGSAVRTTDDGSKPAPTAAPAGSSSTAPIEAATASSGVWPSGQIPAGE